MLEEFEGHYNDKANFVWGRCDPFSDSMPFSIIMDLSSIFSDELREQLSSNISSYELFHKILDELSNLPKSTIFIFEDMHWADKLSIDLLTFLSRRLSVFKLMFVISYRDDELSQTHPLFSLIASIPSSLVTRIELKPLNVSSVASILNASEEAAANIYKVTNGNPLFVTELASTWKGDIDYELPTSIVDLARARMTFLDSETQRIVEYLSTVQGDILIQWFEGSIKSVSWNTKHLANIIDTGLLIQRSESGYKFKHELLRLAIESQMSILDKVNAQSIILSVLEASPSTPVSQLIHHSYEANRPQKTIEYALSGATSAEDRGAHQELSLIHI